MKVTEIIRMVMNLTGVKPSILASRLGIKNNVLSERLSQTNISVVKLNEMLRVLDYKVVVVPSDRRLKEGEFEITTGEEKPKYDLTSLLSTGEPSEEPIISKDGKIKLT